jgi:hypothetical protein
VAQYLLVKELLALVYHLARLSLDLEQDLVVLVLTQSTHLN